MNDWKIRPGDYKKNQQTFISSTQLRMEIFLLMYVKMPTTVGNVIFLSRKNSILLSTIVSNMADFVIRFEVIFFLNIEYQVIMT